MPTEKEFAFGKRAVEEGLLSQSRLEEGVELLHSLERVGSDKRLWDVLVERGWLRSADVDHLQGFDDAQAVINTPSLPPEQLPGTYLLAHIRPRKEPEIIHLKRRPMSFGRMDDNDVTLHETNVEMRHARITHGPEGPRVWDMGSETGVIINGTRRRNHDVKPFDLVRLGDAMLVVCYELQSGDPVAEPVTPAHAVGRPVGRFVVTEGAREGQSFFLGERGIVFGRHKLAAVRLTDKQVGLLHTHVCVTDKGIQFLDLLSPFGTAHNDRAQRKGPLEHGDSLRVGEATLRFERIGSDVAAPAKPKSKPAPRPRTKPEEDGEGEPAESTPDAPDEKDSRSSIFDIPMDAELDDEDADDPLGLRKATIPPYLVKRKEPETPEKGEKAPPAGKAKPAPRRDERFELGEACMLAVAGPIKGQFLPMVEREMTLGRENDVDITIPDPSVSRRHARFTLSEEGKLAVEDAGSRNGVRLNGRPVTRSQLQIGDVVKLGSTVLKVQRAKK